MCAETYIIWRRLSSNVRKWYDKFIQHQEEKLSHNSGPVVTLQSTGIKTLDLDLNEPDDQNQPVHEADTIQKTPESIEVKKISPGQETPDTQNTSDSPNTQHQENPPDNIPDNIPEESNNDVRLDDNLNDISLKRVQHLQKWLDQASPKIQNNPETTENTTSAE